MEIKNAKVTSTSLGYEDHRILTFGLCLDISGGGGVVYGGFALDGYDKEKKKRVCDARSMDVLQRL